SAGLLLAVVAARAQDRGTVTTLPRPTGPYWLISDTQPEPQLLPPPQRGPDAPPPAAPGPPPVLIDPTPQLPPIDVEGAYPPFHHRVRADLLEVGILFPVISQDLNNSVTVPGAGAFATRLPSAPLG